MFDQDTWRSVNTFAPWLSAIGTLSAALVSLYLAHRTTRPRVRVFAAIIEVIGPGDPWDGQKFLQIRVVNHGKPVVISGIGWWRLRLARKTKNWVVLPPNDDRSTRLPKKLDFGEEATVYFPTATFDLDARTLLADIKKARFPLLRMRRLRVGVFATTGHQFWARPDTFIRRFLSGRI